MSSDTIQVTRDMALRFAVQAMRQGDDPQAVDKEFEKLFAANDVPLEERERVRKELTLTICHVLMDLILVYRASLALSNVRVTRELRLPGE